MRDAAAMQDWNGLAVLYFLRNFNSACFHLAFTQQQHETNNKHQPKSQKHGITFARGQGAKYYQKKGKGPKYYKTFICNMLRLDLGGVKGKGIVFPG